MQRHCRNKHALWLEARAAKAQAELAATRAAAEAAAEAATRAAAEAAAAEAEEAAEAAEAGKQALAKVMAIAEEAAAAEAEAPETAAAPDAAAEEEAEAAAALPTLHPKMTAIRESFVKAGAGAVSLRHLETRCLEGGLESVIGYKTIKEGNLVVVRRPFPPPPSPLNAAPTPINPAPPHRYHLPTPVQASALYAYPATPLPLWMARERKKSPSDAPHRLLNFEGDRIFPSAGQTPEAGFYVRGKGGCHLKNLITASSVGPDGKPISATALRELLSEDDEAKFWKECQPKLPDINGFGIGTSNYNHIPSKQKCSDVNIIYLAKEGLGPGRQKMAQLESIQMSRLHMLGGDRVESICDELLNTYGGGGSRAQFGKTSDTEGLCKRCERPIYTGQDLDPQLRACFRLLKQLNKHLGRSRKKMKDDPNAPNKSARQRLVPNLNLELTHTLKCIKADNSWGLAWPPDTPELIDRAWRRRKWDIKGGGGPWSH